MRKKVFITGEHGMIATAATHYFLKDSDRFELVNWAYDEDKNKDFVAAYKNPEIRELDIKKPRFLEKILETKPDYIIHTAAYVNTDSCESAPKECIDSNVFGTWQVIEGAKKVNARILFLGTTATYDPNVYDGSWADENTIQKPETLYGTTKYDSELLVKNYAEKPIIIRPCFAFGGIMDNPLPNVDKRLYYLRDTSSNITKMIYNSIKRIINLPKFTLNHSLLKDYMSVDDLGNAIYECIRQLACGDYNVSLMQPNTWNTYCYMIENELRKVGYKNCSYELLEEKDYLRNHLIDSRKLRERISWKPRYQVINVIRSVIEKIDKEEYLFNSKALDSHK